MIFLIARSLGFGGLGGTSRGGPRMLQAVTDMFLLERIRHLGSVPEKIEIFPACASATRPLCAATKGIVVEIVARFFESISEAIVSILEIDSGK